MAQYQVLARKWRPQQFDDVIGQEHITQTLVNAIKSKRIAHAYLLVGPRGTGKTTTARILAKALNCEHGPAPKPCETCSNCKEITAGSSMNVMEYDAASNTQVDKIRELIIENVKYAPTSGHYKVYIVDEVHMLSASSFNALLKTLEEPPEHVVFIFATTEVAKLPMTILSRCQRLDFRRLPSTLIVKHLTTITKAENVQIDDAALLAVARGADGCMRDAQSALDQLISFCGTKIGEEDVLGMFGLAAHGKILEMSNAILTGQSHEALKLFNSLAESGKDLQRLLTELIEHFRNLLVVKVAGTQSEAVDVADVELADLKQQSAGVDAALLLRIIETLTGTEARLKFSASKKICFEVAIVRASQAREATGIDGVIQKLNSLRSSAGAPPPPASGMSAPIAPTRSVPVPAPAPTSKPPVAMSAVPVPPPAPAAPVAAPKPPVQAEPEFCSAERLQAIWKDVHDHFALAAPLGREYLNQGRPVSFDGKIFVIGFDPEFKAGMEFLVGSRFRAILQTKLRESTNPDVMLKFELVDDPNLATNKRPEVAPTPDPVASVPTPDTARPTAPAPTPKASAPAQVDAKAFRNDPLIKKALELFRGQIIDVRA